MQLTVHVHGVRHTRIPVHSLAAVLQFKAVAFAIPELPTIWRNRGLHPGKEFQDWVRTQLEDKHITTVAQLLNRMSLAEAGLEIRPGAQRYTADNAMFGVDNPADISKAELKLVTSDIVTQTKVVFPDMADLYYAVSVTD
jgi:hypothetical protein